MTRARVVSAANPPASSAPALATGRPIETPPPRVQVRSIEQEVLAAVLDTGDVVAVGGGWAFLLIAVAPDLLDRLCEHGAELEDLEPGGDEEPDDRGRSGSRTAARRVREPRERMPSRADFAGYVMTGPDGRRWRWRPEGFPRSDLPVGDGNSPKEHAGAAE